LLYGKGQGVQRNDVLAFVWLSAAADQDDKVAANSRDYAKTQLSEVQIKNAEAQAQDYISRYVEPFREKNKSPH
jgi:TPR repeat protein